MKRLALAALLLATPAPPPSVDVHFSTTADVSDILVKEFDGAKSTIDVAVFTFTDTGLADGLIAASKRDGVKVRVLSDFNQFKGGRDRHKEAIQKLNAAAVDVKLVDLYDGKGDPKFAPHYHHKFAVIDGKTLVTGSFNWTGMADSKNHENILILRDDKKSAASYVKEFEDVWNDRRLTKPVP